MRILIGLALLALGCGNDSGNGTDAGLDAAGPDLSVACSGGTCSSIKHLVVVIQENHTFDSYFGKYCTATTGSNPTCNTGPSCCEAGPAKDPGTGMDPIVLDDTSNGARDPNHTHDCEVSEINGGKMDKYISSTASMCGNAGNFAYADPAGPAKPYLDLAKSYALADRYFQPYAGQSSANDMYFARANFVFPDNQYEPDSIGIKCAFVTLTKDFTDPTIADLLNTS